MLCLFDTNIMIDFLKRVVDAESLLYEHSNEDSSMYASEISRAELLAGVKPSEADNLEHFFSVFDWVPIDEPVCRRAGAYAAEFGKSHTGITMEDYLIAASCDVLNIDLVTLNVKDFPMFPDLERPY